MHWNLLCFNYSVAAYKTCQLYVTFFVRKRFLPIIIFFASTPLAYLPTFEDTRLESTRNAKNIHGFRDTLAKLSVVYNRSILEFIYVPCFPQTKMNCYINWWFWPGICFFSQQIQFITSAYMLHGQIEIRVRCVPKISTI